MFSFAPIRLLDWQYSMTCMSKAKSEWQQEETKAVWADVNPSKMIGDVAALMKKAGEHPFSCAMNEVLDASDVAVTKAMQDLVTQGKDLSCHWA